MAQPLYLGLLIVYWILVYVLEALTGLLRKNVSSCVLQILLLRKLSLSKFRCFFSSKSWESNLRTLLCPSDFPFSTFKAEEAVLETEGQDPAHTYDTMNPDWPWWVTEVTESRLWACCPETIPMWSQPEETYLYGRRTVLYPGLFSPRPIDKETHYTSLP